MDPRILSVQEIHISEQKYFEGVGSFPFVFGAANDNTVTIIEAVDWVKHNKPLIESTLLKHGAILFRGFPTNDAAAFSEFVESFGYENLPYVGGAAPRKQVVGNVFTANEAASESKIPFHHEMATTKNWPKKLFFYCDIAAKTGGETSIVLSNEIYKQMLENHGGFVEQLEQKGLKYTRYLPEENDETSAQGRGWKATYGVTTKAELGPILKERNTNFEWQLNGELRTETAVPMPAVHTDVRTGKKVWFNSIVAVYTGWNDSRHIGENCVRFGDGAPLPKEAVWFCSDLMDKLCVNHKWENGDVLMIDNRITMHARRPFDGTRKIYAYLTQT